MFFKDTKIELNLFSNNNKSEKQPLVSIQSYNQSGGITAQTVNVLNTQPQERILTAGLKDELDALVQKNSGKMIIIEATMNDMETYKFSKQIHEYLSFKNYNVCKEVVYCMWLTPVQGVNVCLEKENIKIQIGNK